MMIQHKHGEIFARRLLESTYYKRPQVWRLNPCLSLGGVERMLHCGRKRVFGTDDAVSK